MSKTLKEVSAELAVLTDNRYRTRIAVALPPQRVISHDDDDAEVCHQFFIGDIRHLMEMEEKNPRVRFTTIGAVVFPCTWESRYAVPTHLAGPEGDQPWILIKPEFTGDALLLAAFREAAAADQEWWSTTGKKISMELMEEEALEEETRRAKGRKAAATRKRNGKQQQGDHRSLSNADREGEAGRVGKAARCAESLSRA